MKLADLGWDDFFESAFEPLKSQGLRPARVICELRHAYALNTGEDEVLGQCRGKLLHDAESRSALPAVGDWVAVRPRSGTESRLDILAVLPRKTKFSRRAAGENGHEQVIAANTDTLFILAALDSKINLRRLERYFAVARQSGAEPVLLLNKVDLHEDPQQAIEEVKTITGDAAIVALSAETGRGCPQLKTWLKRGRTVALLGPSGSGKSTLVNRLMRDEVQFTQDVRGNDNKGRHTTTRRELFVTPSGALLIDTPGLRELQLWNTEIADTFTDIKQVALRCRFGNCQHNSEPGCAIREALKSGELPQERWDSYNKLRVEQAMITQHLASRPDKKQKIVWRKAEHLLRVKVRYDANID